MRAVWGIIRGILAVIGAVVVVLVIIGAIVAWNFQKPTQTQQQMRPVAITSAAAQTFEANATAFVNALQSSSVPAGTQLEMVATEQEISSAATEAIDRLQGEFGIPLAVQTVQVNLSAGSIKMTVSAKGTFMFMTLNVAARGTVDIKNDGKNLVVSWDIEELDLGNAPEQVKQIVRDNIGSNMRGSRTLLIDGKLSVSSISLIDKDGQIAIRFVGVKQA